MPIASSLQANDQQLTSQWPTAYKPMPMANSLQGNAYGQQANRLWSIGCNANGQQAAYLCIRPMHMVNSLQANANGQQLTSQGLQVKSQQAISPW
jgi:hypothetical protein